MTTCDAGARRTATTDINASGPGAGFFAYHGIWAPGVRLFRRLRFMSKAMLISLAFIVPMLSMLGWELNAHADLALQSRKNVTREHVEVALGVVSAAHALERSGDLTRAQAQHLARQTLSGIRYGAGEYFWVNDMHPRMVMHPMKPELDGKDMAASRDPNGFALFNAFVDTVRKEGKGFVPYQWPKPGADRPVDKIAYVQGFEPWGWVVGSGIYVDDVRDAMLQRLFWVAAIVAVGLGLAGYLFMSLYRVMDGGLKETRRHLRAMTMGDLTTSPSPWGHDEAAQLMLELRSMQESLRAMVSKVRFASDQIVQSSGEIASGALDLSRRTEQSAANLEETASAMEQIAATVTTAADTSAQASQVAKLNSQVAGQGGTVMGEVIATMDSIRTSSKRITEIIATIDGIAFQTNILALNAAVEAARAGEQGRGFAVVASEVRTLAHRSADAAREIKGLIDQSVVQVDAGAGIVRRAGETMTQIVSASQRVDNLLGDVAHGAREQSLGIGKVGAAVQELDRMTQQNAALVKETAAAAGSMKQLAHDLALEVSKFRMERAEN